MKIALAQINSHIGDLKGNVERCLAAIETAHGRGADLVVLPEMAVSGYPPRDILFDTSFTEAVFEANEDLAQHVRGAPATVVGTLLPSGRHLPGHPGLLNAAILLEDGKYRMVAAKRLLPAYDVFFESRWFLSGPPLPPVRIAGRQVGFLICEDLRDEGHDIHPPADLITAGAELLICLAASPYHQRIMEKRLYHACRPRCPLLYVNLCGANDELIFDGRSFALNKRGEVVAQLAGFQEALQIVELEEDLAGFEDLPSLDPEEELYFALVLGVRDFARKNHVERAFLGLSGGIDSAVVAAIAAEALWSDRVTAVAIPSRYTDPRSTACARELAETLGIHFETVELEPLHAAAEAALGDLCEGGVGAENIQARLRAMILMGFVNRYGGMLLNTSNKTELALGYSTIYGDMAGTLCPIADVTKTEIIELAHWIDTHRAPIPRFTLERPPSAELRPDQVDPFDYAVVAPEMEQLVQADRSDIRLRQSEHKRWQMGVVLKVSERAFGTGRMIPITRR